MGKFNVKKSHSRSFCTCFDPDSVENNGLAVGETERYERSVETVVSYSSAVKQKHDKDVVASSSSRKNKLTRRSFSRFFKAIFFETSLMKKIRNQKTGQKLINKTEKSKPLPKVSNTTFCYEDYDSSSCKLSPSLSTTSGTMTTNTTNSSSTSASTTATAATSRCSSLSQSVENCMQVIKVEENHGNGYNVAIWSFFISLMVLVLWGKVCAIFCTSTWLFFAYQWTGVIKPDKIAVIDHDPIAEIVGAELYKKKVIMEGFLERNHCQNRTLALLKQCC